jgi:hypothetical protein
VGQSERKKWVNTFCRNKEREGDRDKCSEEKGEWERERESDAFLPQKRTPFLVLIVIDRDPCCYPENIEHSKKIHF